ncbi:hypothetical protein EVAR_60955_1 [Eumeta japonica]|uniref:Uncharacterized protein n=1 Tax=Eumeta variegata TaxID=151549 RepID=A0A4C1XTQ0_EUMVA|nr:hypothetical protein EVAR_60955_1 [Eumeta japonica]
MRDEEWNRDPGPEKKLRTDGVETEFRCLNCCRKTALFNKRTSQELGPSQRGPPLLRLPQALQARSVGACADWGPTGKCHLGYMASPTLGYNCCRAMEHRTYSNTLN